MAHGNPELWQSTHSLQKESQLRRLKDNASSLLEQYGGLLRSGQVLSSSGAVDRGAGALQSSVLAAGMLQATESLLQLSDELRRAALLGDHAAVGDEVAATAAAHEAAATDGDRRLQAVADEMQAALRELETSYYGCSARRADS